MAKTRVLIVEDSLTVRGRLQEALSADPDLEVIGEAEDGKRAIELCMRLRPEVVTLDMMLPVLSGLEVTEYLMAYCPTQILIISSSVNRGELFKTYETLAAGAVEILEKPRGDTFDDEWERRIVAMVKLVSRVKVITHPRLRLGPLGRVQPPAATRISRQPTEGPPKTPVAIGASTGGPGAVVEILRYLSFNFPLPILLVIHISELFGGALAEWLDTQSSIRVRYARDGDPLPCYGQPNVLVGDRLSPDWDGKGWCAGPLGGTARRRDDTGTGRGDLRGLWDATRGHPAGCGDLRAPASQNRTHARRDRWQGAFARRFA